MYSICIVQFSFHQLMMILLRQLRKGIRWTMLIVYQSHAISREINQKAVLGAKDFHIFVPWRQTIPGHILFSSKQLSYIEKPKPTSCLTPFTKRMTFNTPMTNDDALENVETY